EPGVRDGDERAALDRTEGPFDGGGAARRPPFDEDALVRLDRLHGDGDGDAVHLPVPLDTASGLQTAAAPGEPEARRQPQIGEGLEDVLDGPADEHAGPRERGRGELGMVHGEFLELVAGAATGRGQSATFGLQFTRPPVTCNRKVAYLRRPGMRPVAAAARRG